MFHDPQQAHGRSERLWKHGFLDVALVPVWRATRRALVRKMGAPGEIAGDELGDPLEALLEHTAQLASEYERLRALPREAGSEP